MLDRVESLVNQLQNTSSRNDKIQILRNNSWCKDILYYVYNPYILYGLTSKKCKKLNDLEGDFSGDIFDLLKTLSEELSGHDSVKAVNSFIDKYGYKELVYSIIDKNLKCRIDAKVVNLAFPNLIPTFNVALAKEYTKFPNKPDDNWLVSRKLDGIRLIARKEDDKVTFWSRSGKQLFTLSNLELGLKDLPSGYVFDGEVCLVKDGVENFQDMMKEIRKKDHTIESPKFFIFDILTLEEFDGASSNVKLSDRLNRFEINNDFVTKLDQERLASYDINSYPEEWEGLILRNDCDYEGKRTANLLKVKKFLDDEFKVIDIETGPYRIIDRGREIEFETLTNVLINYNRNIVSVGSGFTVDERRYYYERPDEIIGATITVQYFGISKNKEGKESLRFPTIKTIHGQERTV